MSKTVTYEIARKLKEIGFRDKVTAYYVDGSLDYNSPINWNTNEGLDENGEYQEEDGYCSAPTTSEALQWIRDKNGIVCYVDVIYNPIEKKAMYLGKILSESGIIIQKKTPEFPTHPEAEESLLKEVVEYLGKIR